MTKRIKSLSKSYKFYETDIWGRISRKPSLSKSRIALANSLKLRSNKDKDFNEFSYRIDITKSNNKKKFESIYKKNLITRQVLRKFYGEIKLKSINRIYKNSLKNKTNILEHFLSDLECRLDIFLYRVGFIPTIFTSRQWINHKHIKVNGKIVNKPNYILKEGDVITISSKMMPILHKNVKNELSWKTMLMYAPAYSEININTGKAIFIRKPKLKEIWYPMNIDLNNILRAFNKQ